MRKIYQKGRRKMRAKGGVFMTDKERNLLDFRDKTNQIISIIDSCKKELRICINNGFLDDSPELNRYIEKLIEEREAFYSIFREICGL